MEAEARRVPGRVGAEEPIAAGVCGTQGRLRVEGLALEVWVVESPAAQVVAEDLAAEAGLVVAPARAPAGAEPAQEADLVVEEWVTEVAGPAEVGV